MYYLSVGAMLKNEHRYLREWIEFHLMVGVEHFFLCSNDDDPALTYQILQPYIQKKIVEIYHSPGGCPAVKQIDIYNHMLTLARNVTCWIAFIDLDEFLMSYNKNKSIADILTTFEQHVGVGINWINYGSSGLYFPPQLQIESFRYRATDLSAHNKTYKSIVHPNQTIKAINPHSFDYVNKQSAVDEYGQQLISGTCTNYNYTYIGKALRINHYRTRSWLDYLEKHKKWTGGGHPDFINTTAGKYNFEYYWRMNNTNDILDDTAHQYVPELKSRLRITRQGEYPVLSPEHPDQITTLHDFF